LGCASCGRLIDDISTDPQPGVTADFVFTEAPFFACHASTLIEVDPGTLLVAYFAGTGEGRPDTAIWLSRGSLGPDGQRDWSAPQQVAQQEDVPCWNPVLVKTRSGEILLFYKVGPSPQTWTGYLKRSSDGGQSWSEPEQLPAGILGPIKNKPIELPDGRLICGSSVESYRAWACWVEITPDAGRTWSKHGPISVPGEPFGIIQPTVFLTSSGGLRMLCRATDRIGRICTSDSRDGGLTWSPARPTDLPNPNAGIDAVRLDDGRIELVYNHSGSDRSPLNVAISNDDGEQFQPLFALETALGEFSYPAVIQTADRRVHVTYTWNRLRIRHAELGT